MRGYPVYRMDPAGRTAVRVGTILEFRKSRRSLNRVGLARLAQRLFAGRPEDIIYIGFESALERTEPYHEADQVESAG
jgi:hypothetical protein